MRGSAKGDRVEGSIGEWTEVASAKRAVLGVFTGTSREEVEDDRDFTLI